MKTIALRARRFAAAGVLALLGGACDSPTDPFASATEFDPELALVRGGTLELVSAQVQQGVAGQLVTDRPTVRTLDAAGVPTADVRVRWYIMEGNGSVTETFTRSDAQGVASVDWRLGPDAGRNRLRATANGATRAVFTAHAAAEVLVADVEVAPGDVVLESVGQMVQLSAVAFDSAGNTVAEPIYWRAFNSAVATVDSAGVVRAVANGRTRITATSANMVSDTAWVTVTQRVATVVTSPPADTVQPTGSTQLAATATDANGYVVAGVTPTWSSLNPTIAAVNTSGLVTGHSAGVATIRATVDGISGESAITVAGSQPPPGDVTYLFASDWSTGTGNSEHVLLDRGKAIPWSMFIGNGRGDVVVPSTGLDFPTANVYHSIGHQRSGGLLAQNPKLNAGQMPTLQVGQTRAWRWYFRMAVPDAIDPTGSTPHPIQDSGAGDFNFEFRFEVHRDGTWRPGFGFDHTPYPNNRFTLPVRLQKNQTYRFELRITRTGATTFQAQARVYDANGALLYDNDDFRNGNGSGSGSLADQPQLTLGNVNLLNEFQVGSNGPSWYNVPASAFPISLWYTGGVAVCANDWCGPYRSGERP